MRCRLDTTANSLSQLLRLIAEDDSLRSAVTDEPEALPRAIEETLRLPPIHGVARTMTRNVEVEGVELRKGERVALFIGAANRDPRKFENPDQFDLARRPNQHLAFGQGIHLCLGNHLARAEIRIGVETLLRAAPHFQSDGAAVIEQRAFLRDVTSLPVSLVPKKRGEQSTAGLSVNLINRSGPWRALGSRPMASPAANVNRFDAISRGVDVRR